MKNYLNKSINKEGLNFFYPDRKLHSQIQFSPKVYQEGLKIAMSKICSMLDELSIEYESKLHFSDELVNHFGGFYIAATDHKQYIELTSPNFTPTMIEVCIWEDNGNGIADILAGDCHQFEDWQLAYDFFVMHVQKLKL